MTRKLALVIVLGCTAFGLAACGSEGAPKSNSSEPPPVQHEEGVVTVQVVTASGEPIPQVWVGIGGNFEYRDATTSAEGRVRFDGVRAGDVGVDVGGLGFHWARRSIVVEADQTTDLTVAIIRTVEATPIVLAAHASPSVDGQSVTVDADLAVLGEDGQAIPTLTAADFRVSGSDCGFGMCVMDASGAPVTHGSYRASIDADAFSWHEAPLPTSAGSATALLLEQSIVISDYDPRGLRAASVHPFLDSVTAPDTVAVASYHGTPQSPIFSTYGTFTSDGALFHDAVDALAYLGGSLNPMYAGLADMLSWTALQPTGTNPKSVVLVSGRSSWPDSACTEYWTCPHVERVSVADSSRALGIPIIAIGGYDPAADIAARSGGLFIAVEDPEQYSVVLGNLKPIVSRQLGFNRLRFVLTGSAQVFASGHTVWAQAQVRVATDSWLVIPVVVLIP